MRIRAAVGLLVFFFLAFLWSTAVSAQIPAGERGFRGLVALRGEDVLAEDVLAEESAERRFAPASVTKLVVAAAALHHLGPEYRVVTSIHAAKGAGFENGVLAGDLVVRAAGDPSWSRRFHPQNPQAPFEALAAELRARGLERVRGALVVDLSRFPGRPAPPTRAVGELAYGYAAPVSGLAIEENTVAIEIAPGRLGEPARLRVPQGLALGDIALENRTRTVGRGRHGKGTIDLWPVWGESRIVVTGEYPVSEPPYRIEASHPEPEMRVARALLAALRERGIEVEGGIRLEYRPRTLGAELAVWRSPPLAELLVPVLEKSHNWLAEMLLRLLAAELGGEGRLDVGLELEREFLENVVGVDPRAFELDDASGISPRNLLTPRAVAELLRWAWRQPWRGVWLEALAAPGEGTLEAWAGLPPLRAKTGSGHQTVAIAGYLGSNLAGTEAEPIVFVVFENRRPDPRPAQRREIAALLRQWASR